MEEAARKERNSKLLRECWPSFGRRVGAMLAGLEKDGIRPRIQQAYRSEADQLLAFARGTTKVKWGLHNAVGKDGTPEALAVDVLDDDAPLAPPTSYLLRLAAAAQAQGLVSGIEWGLPMVLRHGIEDAIATKDWNRPVHFGWDSTHVQPANITISEAKRGMRPV